MSLAGHLNSQEVDTVGRVKVDLNDRSSNSVEEQTWMIAFVGTAGNLPLLIANGQALLPKPSQGSGTDSGNDGNYPIGDIVAHWPPDPATISVWESQRGESEAEAQIRGGGLAWGTVEFVFDTNRDGVSSETVTVSVEADAQEVQVALRALGGSLALVEVSTDEGVHRARNGGKRRAPDECFVYMS